MKRLLTGFIAASIVVGTTIPLAMATTSNANQWFKMTIEVDGAALNHPFGIATSDGSTTTTYIPMFYVNQALTKVGYHVTWDGTAKTWALTSTVTSGKLPTTDVGAGNTSVTLNGSVIKKLNTIMQADPEGGANTTYVPIYYLTPIFQATGMTDVWDGTSHQWSINSKSGNTGGSTGTGSSTGGSTAPSVPAPTIHLNSNDASSISVTGATSGSTLVLYTTTGSEVISTTASSSGTAVFYNVAPGSYDVVDSVLGQNSNPSNQVTVTPSANPTVAPSIFANESNGGWYIGVNNAAATASLTLYNTAGAKIATTTANQYGYATFNDVVSGTYYVVVTVNGQGYQSNAVAVNTTTNPPLTTPTTVVSTANNVEIITVSNVDPGATVNLYTAGGTVAATLTANSSGVAAFNNVANGTYYAEQTSNGQQSAASNSVTVNVVLTPPTLSVSTASGVQIITASNVKVGSTVTLYSVNGVESAAGTANSLGYVSFSNVGNGTYDATQTFSGQTSATSNQVTVSATLSTPNVFVGSTNGVKNITVTNVQAGATVILYTANGAVYETTTANASAYAVFTNVGSGTYYVAQSWNGQLSPSSNNFGV